jgi:hypothetical protein
VVDLLIPVISDNNEMPWSIAVDGFFKINVEKQMLLNDEMTQESIDDIFNNAARILNKCPNPNEVNETSKTGIVIGKVQSGKTSNFISVLSLAFDNGYDIAIVLGGNTLDLLKQNANRINSAFNVDTEKLTILKTNDNKSLINPLHIKEFIENGRKIIIVGLKRYNHISQISEIFDNSYLSDKSVLIVDDEGDQATLNTKAFLKSMSTTYKAVVDFKSKLKSHCFLSITATPQANILIDAFDILSPDFGELVYPGEGYCGLQEFHGENGDKHIKEIPMSDGNLIDVIGVPSSVYAAMSIFFVGNAIRRSRGDFNNHAMLIHPSQKKFDHRVVVNKIQEILDDWKAKAKIKLSGKNDLSYSTLKQYLNNALTSFQLDGIITHSFEKLEATILDVIKQCSPVHICNSEENASENSKLYKTNIFVGGNLVERGITIKGLAVTYITRRAKGKSNVDNIEQRARWFGYKADYLDVCRVFTTRDIKEDFTSILEHDEDMWATIERARDNGIAFKDMPRIFVLARKAFLNMTRRNVARTEYYSLSEWKLQKYLNNVFANHNETVFNNFKKICKDNIKVETYNPTQIHSIIENRYFSEIYNEILSKLKYDSNEIINLEYFNTFNEALNKVDIQPLVDLVWVRDKFRSTRKISEAGTVEQLFQGRNPNTNSPQYYEGDRSLANKKPNNIQLQIHYVKPTNIPDITSHSPLLALYVPQWCADKLSKLEVRRNEK